MSKRKPNVVFHFSGSDTNLDTAMDLLLGTINAPLHTNCEVGDSITFDWYDRYGVGKATRKVIGITRGGCPVVRFKSCKWIVRKEEIRKIKHYSVFKNK